LIPRRAKHQTLDVRYGSKADIRDAIGDVRFAPESGQALPRFFWRIS
jgi:hypothetical protein